MLSFIGCSFQFHAMGAYVIRDAICVENRRSNLIGLKINRCVQLKVTAE